MFSVRRLRLRLERIQRPIAVVVGSALSVTRVIGAPSRGVPDVGVLIQRVRSRMVAEDLGKDFEDALREAKGSHYQEAFAFVQSTCGANVVDEIIREAVLEARLLGTPTSFDGDGNPAHWHLPRGTAALGRLLAAKDPRFTGPILTTNFDPLLSMAIEHAGGSVDRRVLDRDGHLPGSGDSSRGVRVVHLHGYWRGTTLHLPQHLTAPRPKLLGSLRELLSGHAVLVVGYGGWNDAFMHALAQVHDQPETSVEILWCLYGDEGTARHNNRELLDRFERYPAFTPYYGVDAHELFDRLAPPEGSSDAGGTGSGGEARSAKAEVPSSQLDTLAARIRQGARQVYNAHAFMGLPDSGPRPKASLTSIYVPQRFAVERAFAEPARGSRELLVAAVGNAFADGFDFDALASHLFDENPPPSPFFQLLRTTTSVPRFVILGGPGFGKSTLSRYLALRAAYSDSCVPVLLSIRDWAAEGGRESLVEAVARQIRTSLSISLEDSAIESLCQVGHVLLLIDGVDEVNGTDRARLQDQIHGFVASHSQVRVVVTSRHLGYHEAPLDSEAFVHLSLQPFDDDRLREFVTRWYQIALPDDADGRAADLLAALAAEPRVMELARRPMLATLIALVHRHQTELPGRRARLYELCVELLVLTWPEATHRTFSDLRGDWQIARLEELALWMQRKRADASKTGGVLVAARELEDQLASMLREHGAVDEPGVERRLARRWLPWLVKSGVLQEERHGAYTFLHLSLMEYLAGRALLRELVTVGHAQVAKFVVEHHARAHWTESLLLMLGSEASNRPLCSAVIEALLLTRIAGLREVFLLALLREEIEIDDEERARLLASVADGARYGDSQRVWTRYRTVVRDIVRFGRIHSEATRTWLEAQLGTRRGKSLLEVSAMVPEDFPLPERLRARDPADLDLVPLMELGHIDPWGQWALGRAPAFVWLDWALSSTPRGALSYALMATHTNYAYSDVWIAGLLRRCTWLALLMAEAPINAHLSLRWQHAGVSMEVPQALAYQCQHSESQSGSVDNRQGMDGYLSATLSDLSLGISNSLGAPHASLSRESARRFRRFNQVQFVAANFSSFHRKARAPAKLLVGLSDFADFLYKPQFNNPIDRHELELVPGTSQPSSLRAELELPWELATDLPADVPESWPMALALFASFHAGFHAGTPDDGGTLLAEQFVHNLWLNLYFDGVVEYARAGNGLSPSQHALLLALGLAQYQTTWRWPLSAHWQTWFVDNTPPEHWLAAYVWHLCHAVADPTVPAHLGRAAVCLDRAEWPELAAAIRHFKIAPNHGNA